MWQNAVQALVNFYKSTKVSGEQRSQYTDTVFRLRRRPQQPVTDVGIGTRYGETDWNYCDSKGAVEPESGFVAGALANHGASETRREATLFNTMGEAALKLEERKAVGHWFTMSIPATRDKRIAKLERSYDVDFKPGLGFKDANLGAFLIASAKKQALEAFARKNRYAVDPLDYLQNKSSETILFKEINPEAPATQIFEPSTPPNMPLSRSDEIILSLAQHENATVRASVAGSENAPAAAMWLLAEDDSTNVKLHLVSNCSCPLAILEKLSSDSDFKVRRRAQSKLHRLWKSEVGIASGNLSPDGEVENEKVLDEPFGSSLAV